MISASFWRYFGHFETSNPRKYNNLVRDHDADYTWEKFISTGLVIRDVAVRDLKKKLMNLLISVSFWIYFSTLRHQTLGHSWVRKWIIAARSLMANCNWLVKNAPACSKIANGQFCLKLDLRDLLIKRNEFDDFSIILKIFWPLWDIKPTKKKQFG